MTHLVRAETRSLRGNIQGCFWKDDTHDDKWQGRCSYRRKTIADNEKVEWGRPVGNLSDAKLDPW